MQMLDELNCPKCGEELPVSLYRHPEGISLNGQEYLLDEDGDVRLFGNQAEAVEFLASHGITDMEAAGIYFQGEYTGCLKQ